jgi:hypothetical protein
VNVKYRPVKGPGLKRITVLITEENNKNIQRFRSEYMNETQEGMSYAEALNWLLHFGISDWFRTTEDLRKRFYKIWAESPSHKKYATAIDEFDFLEFIQKKKNYLESER